MRLRISSVSSTRSGATGSSYHDKLLRLEPARDALGKRHVEKAMAVDHQLDIGADGVAHRDDARDAVLGRGFDRRRRRAGRRKTIPRRGFHRAEPLLHGRAGSWPRILPACAAASRDSRSRTQAGCPAAFRRTGCRSARRALFPRDPTAPVRSRCRPSPESDLGPSRAALRLAGMRRSRAETFLRRAGRTCGAPPPSAPHSSATVLAKPNASDASPSPVSPASVPSRTKSHTVRAVARIGNSSSVVTRSFGAASRKRGNSAAPAAALRTM